MAAFKGLQRWLSATLFLVVITTGSSAIAEEWMVAKSTGQVWIGKAGVQSVALTQGSSVQSGSTITTSRNGRALLVSGEKRMLVSPNSVVKLPRNRGDSSTVLQAMGNVLYEVNSRAAPHFSVETPWLAAVVKGTQFTVAVGSGGSQVKVSRGRVRVSDHRSGQQDRGYRKC